MTEEKFRTIFENNNSNWEGDNTMQGLLILAKYIDITKTNIIVSASHDIIYSVDIDTIIDAGITVKDAEKLKDLNWMIEEEYDCLACFV